MPNILVIDDEPDILKIVKIGLEHDGHSVKTIDNALNLNKLNINFYDVILLDIRMPQKDGFEVIKEIRNLTDSPIVFLTANDDEESITYGLGLGADDYLTKPFRIPELRARISAHIRRDKRENISSLNLGEIRFNIQMREMFFRDVKIPLTKGEYEICEFLAKNRGRIYTKEQIYEVVFGYNSEGDSSSIATHIKNIRRKFENPNNCPIHTKWGVGYVWG